MTLNRFLRDLPVVPEASTLHITAPLTLEHISQAMNIIEAYDRTCTHIVVNPTTAEGQVRPLLGDDVQSPIWTANAVTSERVPEGILILADLQHLEFEPDHSLAKIVIVP